MDLLGEDKAKRHGDVLFDDAGKYTMVDQNVGTPYEKHFDVGAAHVAGDKLGETGYTTNGMDGRDYMYGRTPMGAEQAVGDANAIGADARNVGLDAQYFGHQAVDQGREVGDTGTGLMQQRTNDAAYFNARDTGMPWATQLATMEGTEGPSAAQSQLQAGTDKAAAQQLMLARSGRGMGGNAAAMGLAQTNLAGIDANQATSAATLRASEDAAWRQRRASNLNAATGQILQSQAQNDAMVNGMVGYGQDAYFRGQAAENQGYQTALGADQTATGALQTDVSSQQLRDQIRGRELDAGGRFEDNQLRAWAAMNGYNLGQQQREDQKESGLIAAGATLLASSDIRAKKDIQQDDVAATDFGRTLGAVGTAYATGKATAPVRSNPAGSVQKADDFGRDLYFDGTLMRSKDDHPGGYDPTERQGFRSATAMPAQPGESMTPMQQEYFGAKDFPRPDVRQPDTNALDVAAQDAVRKAPGSWYDYKDPGAPGANDQRNYGPMAQDLAATPAGATAVVKQPNGKLGVDTGRLSLVNTSALSAQQKQLDDMAAQLDSLNAQTKDPRFAPDFNTRYGVGAR